VAPAARASNFSFIEGDLGVDEVIDATGARTGGATLVWEVMVLLRDRGRAPFTCAPLVDLPPLN
jgi:hypothetical protein